MYLFFRLALVLAALLVVNAVRVFYLAVKGQARTANITNGVVSILAAIGMTASAFYFRL